MSGRRLGWIPLARSLGQALGELARAEITAFREDLSVASRQLRSGALWIAAAAACALVALVSAAVAAFELLALALPRWGAALTVCGVATLATFLLRWLGRRRWRGIEGPAALLRRRTAEHLAWWQETFHGETPIDGQERASRDARE